VDKVCVVELNNIGVEQPRKLFGEHERVWVTEQQLSRPLEVAAVKDLSDGCAVHVVIEVDLCIALGKLGLLVVLIRILGIQRHQVDERLLGELV